MLRHMVPRFVLLLLILVGLYGLLPQLKGFKLGWQTFAAAQWAWVAVAGLLTLATYGLATLLYTVLALHQLNYGKTLLVQASSAFVNRLLPAGFGAIGLNVAYLRRQQHSYSEAAVVVAGNNLLGIIGHLALLAAAVLLGDVSLQRLGGVRVQSVALVLAGVIVTSLLVAALLPRVRVAAVRSLRTTAKNFATFRRRPHRLVAGLLISMLLTLTYVGILTGCATAFGISLSPAKLLVIFSAGALLGTATPTPGGVIGAEAGLLAGFAAYGIPPDKALAAGLLFRFLTYWLPLLPGVVAFILVQRRLQLVR